MTPEQQKQLHDALVEETIKQGKLVESGFLAFRATVIDPTVPQVHVDEMRLAYMAGAQHLFASMMSALDAGDEPTDADMHRMDRIAAELDAFVKVLKLRTSQRHGALSMAKTLDLEALRRANNPLGEPVGHFTGRCGRCGSRDLWDDNLAYGCNTCDALLATDIPPRLVRNAGTED